MSSKGCKKRRLVHLSDDESADESQKDDFKKPDVNQNDPVRKSFISSNAMKNFRDMLENCDKYLEKRIAFNEKLEKEKQIQKQTQNSNETNNPPPPEIIVLDDDDDLVITEAQKSCNMSKSPSLVQDPPPPPPPTATAKPAPELIDLDDESPKIVLDDSHGDMDLNLEQYLENAPMRIMVKRLDRIEMFQLLRSEPLVKILDEIGKRFDIAVPKIILYLHDKIVDAKATPKSLQLTAADIFEIFCRGTGKSATNDETAEIITTDANKAHDPNFILLHLHDQGKKRISIRVNRFITVRQLAELYVRELTVKASESALERIQLSYELESMDFEKRIDQYDLEDEDLIEVFFN